MPISNNNRSHWPSTASRRWALVKRRCLANEAVREKEYSELFFTFFFFLKVQTSIEDRSELAERSSQENEEYSSSRIERMLEVKEYGVSITQLEDILNLLTSQMKTQKAMKEEDVPPLPNNADDEDIEGGMEEEILKGTFGGILLNSEGLEE
ncbi:hypothetical protein HAX54_008282, partial [Datura stramonium]|nr:hypothetical protein [Datura stramonium]